MINLAGGPRTHYEHFFSQHFEIVKVFHGRGPDHIERVTSVMKLQFHTVLRVKRRVVQVIKRT